MTKAVRHETVGGAASWLGEDLQNKTSWLTEVTNDDIAEIEVALAGAEASDLTPATMTKSSFPLPRFGKTLERIGDEVERGPGFALIRGLPVQRWGTEQASLAYAGVSAHLGKLVSQNRDGDRMMPIRDAGQSADDVNVRAPATNAKLYYHSDFADIVGLMCLHPAKEGGVSRICSSIAIHDTLVAEGRADLIDAFYEGFPFDRKGEQVEGLPTIAETPVPMLSIHDGMVSFRYVPGWTEAAVRRTGRGWSDVQKAALDEVNRLANLPKYYLDMHFQPGDIQYLNNYSVLHSRTAFIDYPEPERRRFLLRVWLRADRGRELAPKFDRLFHPDRSHPRWHPRLVRARVGGVTPA